ncbi:uncharacterized protein V6R79_021211 [Siganus canaliculatus]
MASGRRSELIGRLIECVGVPVRSRALIAYRRVLILIVCMHWKLDNSSNTANLEQRVYSDSYLLGAVEFGQIVSSAVNTEPHKKKRGRQLPRDWSEWIQLSFLLAGWVAPPVECRNSAIIKQRLTCALCRLLAVKLTRIIKHNVVCVTSKHRIIVREA